MDMHVTSLWFEEGKKVLNNQNITGQGNYGGVL